MMLLLAMLCADPDVDAEAIRLKALAAIAIQQQIDTPAPTAPAKVPASVNPRRRIVEVGATWCGPCVQWMRDVYPAAYRAGVVVTSADIDSNPAAAAFKVSRVPTFVLMDGDREIGRHEGYMTLQQTLALWEQQPAAPGPAPPTVQRPQLQRWSKRRR